MTITDLDFAFPQELIALEPSRPTRVAFVGRSGEPQELNLEQLLTQFRPGDLLVLNASKVIPARIFSIAEVEFLFLRSTVPQHWEVLFPAQGHKVGDEWQLPDDVTVTLVQKGLPQTVRVSRALDSEYFQRYGEMALPPYIQAARGQRHNQAQDALWYQTAWAEYPGSVAAPTASLHFKQTDIDTLKQRGVETALVTLHVGAGTFLPVRAANLKDHEMHREWAEIPPATLKKLAVTKERGGRVWALGTTVARTLESHAAGLLQQQTDGSSAGLTQLFIYPPYTFQIVDGLLTNFHQPKSTLFGLVAAFAGLERAKSVYAWAIERRFRLFSYGDLTAWIKP